MLSPKAVGYIINTHFSKGRSPATIVERWNRGYPDAPIVLAEVEKVLAETIKLREEGDRPALATDKLQRASEEKPALKVVKKAKAGK